MNKIPRKTFVLNIAKTSNPLEIFFANIWVIVKTIPIKRSKNSIENTLKLELITKNQNDNPAVTASDLNLGDDVCIFKLDRWRWQDQIELKQ